MRRSFGWVGHVQSALGRHPGWSLGRSLALGCLVSLSLMTAAVANAATPAGGTLTVAPGSAVTGSHGNAFVFTYAAPSASRAQGLLLITFPGGFTAPQTRDPNRPGYVSVLPSSCRPLGVLVLRLGAPVLVVPLDCPAGASLRISYAGGGSGVTVPSRAGTYSFPSEVVLTAPLRAFQVRPSPMIVIGAGTGDGAPPVLTLPGTITTESHGTAGAPAAYTATALDATDGPVPVTCAPSSGATFPIGSTTVACQASDAAGNTAHGTFLVVVTPAVAPTVTFDSPADGARIGAAATTVAVDVVDTGGVAGVTIDGAPASLVAGRYRATIPLSQGANTIVAVATDLAGNTGAASIAVRSNTIAPALDVTAPADGTLTGAATIGVAGTASPGDPADGGLAVTVDGVPAALSAGAFAATMSLVEGPVTLTVTATDGYGLTTSRTLTVVRDSTPPELTVSGVADGQYRAGIVSPSFGASDDHLASVAATLDGAPFASGTPVSDEGSHVLSVTAGDTLGNSSTRTVTFTIDRTPPEVSVTGFVDGLRTRDPVTPQFGATDANLLDVSATLDGAAFSSGTEVSDEGDHVLRVTATDLAGNTTTVVRSFTIDRTPPVVVVATPVDGALIYGSSAFVGGTVSDDGPIASLTVNGVPAAIVDGAFGAAVALELGPNTITVVATDSVGNVATVELTVQGLQGE